MHIDVYCTGVPYMDVHLLGERRDRDEPVIEVWFPEGEDEGRSWVEVVVMADDPYPGQTTAYLGDGDIAIHWTNTDHLKRAASTLRALADELDARGG